VGRDDPVGAHLVRPAVEGDHAPSHLDVVRGRSLRVEYAFGRADEAAVEGDVDGERARGAERATLDGQRGVVELLTVDLAVDAVRARGHDRAVDRVVRGGDHLLEGEAQDLCRGSGAERRGEQRREAKESKGTHWDGGGGLGRSRTSLP